VVNSKVIKILDQDARKWSIRSIADISKNDIFSVADTEDDLNVEYYRAASNSSFNSEEFGFGVEAEQIIGESLLAALIPGYKRQPVISTSETASEIKLQL
jgi:hypothetical protein